MTEARTTGTTKRADPFGLSDAQVLEMRRRFRSDDPLWTLKMLEARSGAKLPRGAVSKILLGQFYAHVPEPVTPEEYATTLVRRRVALQDVLNRTNEEARRKAAPVTDEVILFIRLIHATGKVGPSALAKAYPMLTPRRIEDILRGRGFRHVPMPEKTAKTRKNRTSVRDLIPDEVALFMRLVAVKGVERDTIAKAYPMLTPDQVKDVLRGHSFRHVPMPGRESSRARPRSRLIPIRPVRLPDHDCEINHVARAKLYEHRW